MADKKFLTIEEYIQSCPEERQSYLFELYYYIKSLLPKAEERMSWQMPTFWQGKNIIHFADAKKHVGLYPGTDAVLWFAEELKDYQTTKGSIHLSPDKEIPKELLRKIIQYNLDNIV